MLVIVVMKVKQGCLTINNKKQRKKNMNSEIKILMTQSEAAAYLHTTVGTLNSWRHYGKDKIPFIRWGNRIRYRKEDLDAWIQAHIVNPENKNV